MEPTPTTGALYSSNSKPLCSMLQKCLKSFKGMHDTAWLPVSTRVNRVVVEEKFLVTVQADAGESATSSTSRVKPSPSTP